MLVGIVGWIVVGLLVGFLVSKVMDLHGDDPRLGVAVAAIGGVAGGVTYRLYGGEPVVAFNPWSLTWAAGGAMVAVAVWHAVRSRFVSRVKPTVRRSY